MRYSEYIDFKACLDISHFNSDEFVTHTQISTLYKKFNIKQINNAKILNFLEITFYSFLKNERKHTFGIKRSDFNLMKTFFEETSDPIEYIDIYMDKLNPNVVLTIVKDDNRFKVTKANGDITWFDKIDEIKINKLMNDK